MWCQGDGNPPAGQAARVETRISKVVPTVMATALFMDLLDTSALGSALPTLAVQFHTTPLQLKLALTAYLMTMAVFVPASGWLADRYGARRIFVNAVMLYLLGSLCCGLSSSVSTLVAARVLQGIGGAMMTPVARLIVVATTPRERLVQAMNAFTIPAIIGPLLGPPVAGLLLECANWRWIFFINIPVGIVGIFAVLRFVPRLRNLPPEKFDWPGFVLAAVTIMSVVGLSETAGTGFLSAKQQVALAAFAIAGGIAFVLHALRSAAPMLDLRIFSRPTYRASMLGGALMRASVSASPFLFPLFFQNGLGWTPVRSGLVMTAIMGGSLLARFGGLLAIRVMGFRPALVATVILTAIATAIPAVFRVDTPALLIVVVLVVGGFFRAVHFVGSVALGFADVPPEEVSNASTLSTVIQQISLGFGISLAGFTLFLSAGEAPRLTVSDFSLSFLALAIVTALAVPVYLVLDRNAGGALLERRDALAR